MHQIRVSIWTVSLAVAVPLAVLVWSCWLAGGVSAAERAAGQKWAVLVGVDDYTLAEPLRYCGADQRSLRDHLVAAGFPEKQVFLLDDKAEESRFRPSRGNIERQVDAVLKLAAEDDLVVLGFSGHGTQIGKSMYLVPGDGDPEDASSLVSLDGIYERLQSCVASTKLVIVDACRNDPSRGGRRSAGASEGARALSRSLKEVRLPVGTVLFNSCAPGEISWEEETFEHGVFMHYVLQGLSGRADVDRDGRLSLNELAKYATHETKTYVLNEKNVTQYPYLRSEGEADLLDYALLPVPKMPAAERAAKPGEVTTNSIGMKLVVIPAGEFQMGSAEKRNENPIHAVRITRPFLMGQSEVTLGEFLAFYRDGYAGRLDCEKDGKGGDGWKGAADAVARSKKVRRGERFDIWYQSRGFTPWAWGHPDMDMATESGRLRSFSYPVVNVSWNDAVAFCEWLSRKEGTRYRLPTEAEWEFACRAGTTTRYWTGDDPETLAHKENVVDQSAKFHPDVTSHWVVINANDGQPLSSPVRSFRPNPFGLFDMHGNVAEWCGDWYDENFYLGFQNQVAVDPKGPATGSRCVVRGGGWVNGPPTDWRSAYREPQDRSYRSCSLGFRVVSELERAVRRTGGER